MKAAPSALRCADQWLLPPPRETIHGKADGPGTATEVATPGTSRPTITLRAQDSRVLAVAEVVTDFEAGTVMVQRVVAGEGELLCYYFQDGAREVSAEFGSLLLRGMLKTRWADNRRQWLLRLQNLQQP